MRDLFASIDKIASNLNRKKTNKRFKGLLLQIPLFRWFWWALSLSLVLHLWKHVAISCWYFVCLCSKSNYYCTKSRMKNNGRKLWNVLLQSAMRPPLCRRWCATAWRCCCPGLFFVLRRHALGLVYSHRAVVYYPSAHSRLAYPPAPHLSALPSSFNLPKLTESNPSRHLPSSTTLICTSSKGSPWLFAALGFGTQFSHYSFLV